MKEVAIYTDPGNSKQVEVLIESETVWLSLSQLSELFDRDKSVISRHIKNVFSTGELDPKSTVAKNATVQTEGARKVSREIEHYNLDMIISVGYKVNSKRGTQFRQWATQRLKDHLVKGYTINEKRLKEYNASILELKRAVDMIQAAKGQKALNTRELSGLLDIVARYARSLQTLDLFDRNELEIKGLNEKITFTIDLEQARTVIAELRKSLKASALFGNEKDKSFGGILKSIVQTWEGKYLYKSIEEQAAHLLYFVIKNHPFTDGNKRIGAFLFVWFLDRNKHRLDGEGQAKINANGLTALALLVAQSDPAEKESMIKLIINLIRS